MTKKQPSVPMNVFNSMVQEAPLREISVTCPMYAVTVRSCHKQDTLRNIRKMALGTLKDAKHGQY